MPEGTVERRRYLRIEAPMGIRIITEDNRIDTMLVKNISPLGLRFESDKELHTGETLDLRLILPDAKNPVHIQGKIVWQKPQKSAPGSGHDVGCEFQKIEEDNKNTFLKYLCDLIYSNL